MIEHQQTSHSVHGYRVMCSKVKLKVQQLGFIYLSYWSTKRGSNLLSGNAVPSFRFSSSAVDPYPNYQKTNRNEKKKASQNNQQRNLACMLWNGRYASPCMMSTRHARNLLQSQILFCTGERIRITPGLSCQHDKLKCYHLLTMSEANHSFSIQYPYRQHSAVVRWVIDDHLSLCKPPV